MKVGQWVPAPQGQGQALVARPLQGQPTLSAQQSSVRGATAQSGAQPVRVETSQAPRPTGQGDVLRWTSEQGRPGAAQVDRGQGSARPPQHPSPTSTVFSKYDDFSKYGDAEQMTATDYDSASLSLSRSTLCSTVINQNQPPIRGLAERSIARERPGAGGGDSSSMLQVQEGLARLTSRFDSNVGDLQTEVTWLRNEVQAKADATSACETRLSALERRVNESEEEQAACLSRVRALEHALEQGLAELRAAAARQGDELCAGLADEAEARCEAERMLSKELRDQAASEAERAHAVVMREMRERIDGQKNIRDEVQFQQQALVRLQTRVDEAFVELRAEIPRLHQETSANHADIDKLSENHQTMALRVEVAERGLAEEAAARRAGDRSVEENFREQTADQAARLSAQVADVRQLNEQVSGRVNGSIANMSSMVERLDRIEQEVADESQGLQRLSRQLSNLQDDHHSRSQDLQKKIAESEADVRGALETKHIDLEVDLRGWVKSSVLSRVEKLDGEMRDLDLGLRGWVNSSVLSRVETLDGELRHTESNLQSQIDLAVVARANALDSAMQRLESSLKGWVDSSVVNRVDRLNGALKQTETNLRGWVDSTVLSRVAGLEAAMVQRQQVQMPVSHMVAPVPMQTMQPQQMHSRPPGAVVVQQGPHTGTPTYARHVR